MKSRPSMSALLLLGIMIAPISRADGDRTCDNEVRIIDPSGEETPISAEQPNGVAEKAWFQYPHGSLAQKSFAFADIGGCTGSMIGPNVLLTACHCNQHDRTAWFRLYTSPVDQTFEAYACRNLAHTFPDADLSLYWCGANAEDENPGGKHGYLDFDVAVSSGSGLLDVVSLTPVNGRSRLRNWD